MPATDTTGKKPVAVGKVDMCEQPYGVDSPYAPLAEGTLQIKGVGATKVVCTLGHGGGKGDVAIQLRAEGRVFEISADAMMQLLAQVLVREMRIEAIAKRQHRTDCTATPVFIGKYAALLPGGEVFEIRCSACGAEVGISADDVQYLELDDAEGRVLDA